MGVMCLTTSLIYLADFCQMILKWFRDDSSQEEHFKQLMFRV